MDLPRPLVCVRCGPTSGFVLDMRRRRPSCRHQSFWPASLKAGLFLFSRHGSLLRICHILRQLVLSILNIISPDELEDAAVCIGDQVEQIPSFIIELVPVAQRELEIQAATDFLEGYYVHDYLQLPQKY